jgi:hypothetical protein
MSRAELRNYKKTQEIKNEQTDYEIKKLDQVL